MFGRESLLQKKLDFPLRQRRVDHIRAISLLANVLCCPLVGDVLVRYASLAINLQQVAPDRKHLLECAGVDQLGAIIDGDQAIDLHGSIGQKVREKAQVRTYILT
jgi:hypothetical protein